MRLPGRVRLVKGAYEEPEHVALPRESGELRATYLRLAGTLIETGHPVSIATHDDVLLDELERRHGDALRSDHVEFEMLLGLGGDGLDRLREKGYRTREYVVFGGEWWLYALNRISEDPVRLHTALADAVDPDLAVPLATARP
jgi:proline dehydrogenase